MEELARGMSKHPQRNARVWTNNIETVYEWHCLEKCLNMSVDVNPRKAGNITEHELIGSWVGKKN